MAETPSRAARKSWSSANEKRLHMNRNSALGLLEQHPAAGAAQMRIGPLRGNTAARRPRDESLPQEIRFVNVTNGIGFLADRCRQGLDPTGPPSNLSMIALRMARSILSNPQA